jgi:hypothetical protein
MGQPGVPCGWAGGLFRNLLTRGKSTQETILVLGCAAGASCTGGLAASEASVGEGALDVGTVFRGDPS